MNKYFFQLVYLTIVLQNILLIQANPILGLVDSRCHVITEGYCPNENVTFWLYNKANIESPLKLDVLDLKASDFQPKRPVKIILHGYTGHRDFAPNTQIRPVLLAMEDLHVISIDYGPLVPEPCYFAAVQNLPVASQCLAQLINNLVEQNIVLNEDIHIIGFSLGAQVAGQTANYVKQKLKHITGLDPAKPMFITASNDNKLDPSDAEFVDVIHTDVLGRGMLSPMGHADFYPNIGPYQPGCQLDNEPGSCNHERAPVYYAESILSSTGFWSYACPSWVHYIFGLCSVKLNDAIMGYHVNKSAVGSFFLETGHMSPFALGPFMESDNPNISNDDHYTSYDMHDEIFEPLIYKALVDLVYESEPTKY